MPTCSGRQREPFRFAFGHAEDQLGVLPNFVLTMIDVEREAANIAEQYIVIADDQLSFVETHRQAAVAAPARLEEHHRPSLADQVSDGGQGGRGGGHPRNRC